MPQAPCAPLGRWQSRDAGTRGALLLQHQMPELFHTLFEPKNYLNKEKVFFSQSRLKGKRNSVRVTLRISKYKSQESREKRKVPSSRQSLKLPESLSAGPRMDTFRHRSLRGPGRCWVKVHVGPVLCLPGLLSDQLDLRAAL